MPRGIRGSAGCCSVTFPPMLGGGHLRLEGFSDTIRRVHICRGAASISHAAQRAHVVRINVQRRWSCGRLEGRPCTCRHKLQPIDGVAPCTAA
jgi:hypothetical protein